MNRRLTAVMVFLLCIAGILLLTKLNRPRVDNGTADSRDAAILPSAPNPPIAVAVTSNLPAVAVPNPVATPTAPVIPKPVAPVAVSAQVPPASAPPGIPPAMVLENMRSIIRNYGSRFGGNPVGNNVEITKALDGENPGQAHFISDDSGLRINEKGELVDPWGTPFFFHQLSGKEMEIRSAGPDRKMWTVDDLVTK